MAAGMFPANLHVVTVVPDTGNRYLEPQHISSQKSPPIQSPGQVSNGNHSQTSLSSPSVSLPLGSHNIALPGDQDERLLPTREVTDQSIDDAYVNFIMYCNPSIPLDTDTMELRKVFRAPPKSDGKSFSTFTLFELIGRLEADDDKEIKTWAALVENLGVEKPSVEKKQSTQKVQQYAVRLKRWMHAMHIDAFFEFLLNKKPHVYWTQVPAVNDSASVQERDGVPAEEDLALRALLPETRPKRGRRRAEDREDIELGKSPSQRPRIESPTLTEGFVSSRLSLASEKNGTPATAHPDVQKRYGDRMVPWSATEVRTAIPEIFHWPPEDSRTPNSAYPQSAVTPTVNRTWNDLDEPQSAITSKSRSRRRHGPAVSSAWLSNGGLSSGKVRGRPPSNRSVQDGPFSTFPANPTLRDSLVNRLSDNTPTASPIVSQPNVPLFFPPQPQPQQQPQPQPQPPSQPSSRPSRLQLQVPERQGGEVRLATPPPVVLVNGQSNSHVEESHDFLPDQYSMPLMQYFNSPNLHDPSLPHFVSITFQQNEPADGTNVDSLESHLICEILAAEWLDLKGCVIERCTIDEADKICKQVVRNLRAESTSDQTFLINLAALAGGPLMTRLRVIRLEEGSVSHYECHWKLRFGAIEGDLKIRAAVQHNPELNNRDDSEPEDSEQSWKERYLELRQEIRIRDEKVGRLKRGVLDALVYTNEFSGVR